MSRYAYGPIAALWMVEERHALWLEIERAVLRAYAATGYFSSTAATWLDGIDVQSGAATRFIQKAELSTGHEVEAFLNYVESYMDPAHRCGLHVGLTSSDLVDTATSIIFCRVFSRLRGLLRDIRLSFATPQANFGNRLRIARTHGQLAERSRWDRILSSHEREFGRCSERVDAADARCRIGKLEGVSGRFVPGLVEKLALTGLGLNSQPDNTQVIARDIYAESLMPLAFCAIACDRFAQNVRLWTSRGEIELADHAAVGSTAMPHKRNPLLAEKICGLSRLVVADCTTLLHNTSLWEDRDLTHSSVDRTIFPRLTELAGYLLSQTHELVHQLVLADSEAPQFADHRSSEILFKLQLAGIARGVAWTEVAAASERAADASLSILIELRSSTVEAVREAANMMILE